MKTIIKHTTTKVRPYVVLLPWTKHAQILIFAGVAYLGVGFTYINAPASPTREVALQLPLRVFPIEIWGWVFAFIGLLAIISSRWPPVTKKWGYVLLTSLSSFWAASYSVAVVFMHSPPGNLSGAFIWADFAFMWWVISGLTEHPRKESFPGDRRRAGSDGYL